MKMKVEESDTSSLKWVVQLDYQGSLVFLTQKEYEAYSDEIMKDAPKPFVQIDRTGEIITTKPVSVQQNPNWIDMKKKEKILKKRELIDEYSELKQQGIFNNSKDYFDWKKEQE